VFSPTLVHEYLTLSAQRSPDKIALVCGDERWTYASVDQYSDQLALFLRELGVERGDRVIIFMDSACESVVSLYGILKAGGVFVLLNGSIKPHKLNYILKDSGARSLITHVSKAGVVKEALGDSASNLRIIWTGASAQIPKRLSGISFDWDTIRRRQGASRQCGKRITTIDQDLATLIYTSGSTGEPKGVMCPHYNMVSAARSIIRYLENTDEDIILNVLPLSFDYGLYQILMAFMFGGTVILERSFVYLAKIFERIEKEKVTGFPVVPTIVSMILRLRNLANHNFSSIRYITNTAAALPVEHIHKLKKVFPRAELYSMYGLTECKRVSYLPPEELENRPSSVGNPIPNCEVYLVDEEGTELGPGGVGELVVRGSNVMRGYWNAPELTAKVYRRGRWPGETVLYTGDLFRKDEEGFLYFVARKDDLIKTRGERVSPKEVENEICRMEGVNEAAVIGIPDADLGQAIKAFVVCGPSVQLTDIMVKRYCAAHLETFMVPKYVQFMEELPRTTNNKIDKKALKEMEPGS
jgi:long-chain acyl-CoA synthetase